MPSAILALEDGSVFEGRSFGASAERSGEVVFNTAITGYQEIFTDPSYAGQIVILTNPQIGNYGTNAADNESAHPHIEGLVVREFSGITSNWRSDEEAREFLSRHGIPVVSELDTRAIVRHLRTRGVMRGVLSAVETNAETDGAKLVEKARQIPTMAGLDLASRVSTAEPYGWDEPVEPCSPSELVPPPAEPHFHVVAYDFGIKQNILRRLVQVGCRVTVVPALTSADGIVVNQAYLLSFDLWFASKSNNCIGVGGSEDSVWLKAGGSPLEPVPLLQSDNYVSINVDKGSQSEGGTNLGVVDNIWNGKECPISELVMLHKTYDHPFPIKTSSDELWIAVGTESGFEAVTGVYYYSIGVRLTPVSS